MLYLTHFTPGNLHADHIYETIDFDTIVSSNANDLLLDLFFCAADHYKIGSPKMIKELLEDKREFNTMVNNPGNGFVKTIVLYTDFEDKVISDQVYRPIMLNDLGNMRQLKPVKSDLYRRIESRLMPGMKILQLQKGERFNP